MKNLLVVLLIFVAACTKTQTKERNSNDVTASVTDEMAKTQYKRLQVHNNGHIRLQISEAPCYTHYDGKINTIRHYPESDVYLIDYRIEKIVLQEEKVQEWFLPECKTLNKYDNQNFPKRSNLLLKKSSILKHDFDFYEKTY